LRILRLNESVISAVDELLREGPVQVVENDRTRYIVLRAEDYERLTAGPSAWDWLERPSCATRDRRAINADLAAERASWDISS